MQCSGYFTPGGSCAQAGGQGIKHGLIFSANVGKQGAGEQSISSHTQHAILGTGSVV